eukprot:CAMPEP_0168510592 /NCGR_PEP_ID=MMETSP0405-20121227/1563_1 /TAXON_ID=498012 /ORGANISM="Trichosphaerium sp, Strain Am-I-7 wt" /LENGTH=161 /DNA_ID=CAMNT_0008528471 /DNA_START=39 /DNA_END=521 /DNA_ORIENTATION=+
MASPRRSEPIECEKPSKIKQEASPKFDQNTLPRELWYMVGDYLSPKQLSTSLWCLSKEFYSLKQSDDHWDQKRQSVAPWLEVFLEDTNQSEQYETMSSLRKYSFLANCVECDGRFNDDKTIVNLVSYERTYEDMVVYCSGILCLDCTYNDGINYDSQCADW